MTKKFTFLFLAMALVLSACRKDTDVTTTTTTGTGTETGNGIPDSEIVTSSLIGTVIDEDNNIVQDATVSYKSNTTTTDENGNFMFSNIQMEVDGSLITVNKAGFFRAFDRVSTTANATSYTRIQLLDRSIISTFPAGATEVVSFDGATVKFQNDSFIDATGNAYNGNVNIAAHWIDPTSTVVEEQMPGDLRALDANNVYSVLETFGMVAVDLIADNGAELHLNEGTTAEINFPIPSELLNAAPTTIPLWSFDETIGVWVEEGSATKVGGMYVGNVTHFSYWNCDAPFPLIEMDGVVVSPSGFPLSGISVCIDFADREWWGNCGLTNNRGNFGGKIPRSESLILTIKDDCDNVIHTMNIGPFTEDVDLGQIAISGIDEFLVQVSGTLVTCDGSPITNGYAVINSNNLQFPGQIDDAGNFSESVLFCEADTEITVAGYDLDALLQSDLVTYPLMPGIGSIDAGTITVCTELEEFLFTTADGSTVNYFDPSFTSRLDTANIDPINFIDSGSNSSGNTDSLSNFSISYMGSGVGTFTQVNSLESFSYNPTTQMKTGYFCQGCAVTVTITSDEGPGGFIQGSYSGEAEEFSGGTIPVSGEFQIERD